MLLSVSGHFDIKKIQCDEAHDEHFAKYNATKNAAALKRLQNAPRSGSGGRTPPPRTPKRPHEPPSGEWETQGKKKPGKCKGTRKQLFKDDDHEQGKRVKFTEDDACKRCNQGGHSKKDCFAKYRHEKFGDASSRVLIEDKTSRAAIKA